MDERLLDWIRSQPGGVTLRDVLRGPREFRSDAEATRSALDRFVSEGYLRL